MTLLVKDQGIARYLDYQADETFVLDNPSFQVKLWHNMVQTNSHDMASDWHSLSAAHCAEVKEVFLMPLILKFKEVCVYCPTYRACHLASVFVLLNVLRSSESLTIYTTDNKGVIDYIRSTMTCVFVRVVINKTRRGKLTQRVATNFQGSRI